MKETKRIESLDIIRGIALMFIIFFHSSIYNFANIHKIDFSNPPIFIVIMSFMALWGGVFIIYSMIVNTVMSLRRSETGVSGRIFVNLTCTALFLTAIHYLLNLILGRWNIDFVNNMPHLTFIAATIRNGKATLPSSSKFFEGSSISTIAVNMLAVGWLLYFMLKSKMKRRSMYALLAVSGSLVILLSFIRVGVFHIFTDALANHNYFLALIYSFTLANPYPIITYISYGLFGALLGLIIYDDRKDLLKKLIIPLSLFIFVFGVAGMMNNPKTISKPDYFWYFKTNFELGFFLFSISVIYLILEGKRRIIRFLALPAYFSRISLTVYLLETALSELVSKAISPIFPGWNQTINSTLVFGFFNVILWSIIVAMWSRAEFKYSLEYFWVKAAKKLGKESTK